MGGGRSVGGFWEGSLDFRTNRGGGGGTSHKCGSFTGGSLDMLEAF